jgi:hypothetical protein
VRLCVRPGDQSRAREIIHEITDGATTSYVES